MNQGMLILRKVVKCREHLIKKQKSQKPAGEILPALKKVKGWTDFYPNAPEHGVKAFFNNNRELIYRLLPGKESKAHDSLVSQIQNYFG